MPKKLGRPKPEILQEKHSLRRVECHVTSNERELVKRLAGETEAVSRSRHRRSGRRSRAGSHRTRQGLRTGSASATFSCNSALLATQSLGRIQPCCRSRRQLEEEGSWWPSAAKPVRTLLPCNRTGRFSSLDLPGGESKTIRLAGRDEVSRRTKAGQNCVLSVLELKPPGCLLPAGCWPPPDLMTKDRPRGMRYG